jgi:hypothetical protein
MIWNVLGEALSPSNAILRSKDSSSSSREFFIGEGTEGAEGRIGKPPGELKAYWVPGAIEAVLVPGQPNRRKFPKVGATGCMPRENTGRLRPN